GRRVTIRLPDARNAHIAATPPNAAHESAAGCRRLGPTSRGPSLSLFASRTFLHISPAVLGPLTSPALPLRRGAGFVEKRWGMQLNRKLLFNIRSSTEDEINETVKGDV
ncbi:hypothetical protein, partial [Bradyrhizobium guangdongense]|uniref:hypothetical protein n=1 Tax=Bradyrhizobium guangdongense TaxID=1325090 RepID=UPI001AEC8B06